MKCKLVDVFTDKPLWGNGLTIFYDFENLTTSEMLNLARETRQFESIFLIHHEGVFSARIFTMEEELDFAGHPLLGLAYHLHEDYGSADVHQWSVRLNKRTVSLSSSRKTGNFSATMDQGKPNYIKTLGANDSGVIYDSLGLGSRNDAGVPAEVVSTGLPYLILPVMGGLEEIQFKTRDITPLLALHGAKFIYALDIKNLEGRTWDNSGKVEDIATGSAAGPVAAYLHKNGLIKGDVICLNQGRFVGRPSQILTQLEFDGDSIANIKVTGGVVKVADMVFSGWMSTLAR